MLRNNIAWFNKDISVSDLTRQTMKRYPVLALLRVHRVNMMPFYMGTHGTHFYCLPR